MSTVIELMEKWQAVYQQKEADYGQSWQKTGVILNTLFSDKEIKLKDPVDFNVLAIFVRVLDKISRASNLYFVADETQVKTETLTETLADAGVYMFMLAQLVSELKAGESSAYDAVIAEFGPTIAEEMIKDCCLNKKSALLQPTEPTVK